MTIPGQHPKPDDQGRANTCTKYGTAKAVTGGFHDGTFGTTLDVSQDYVTTALVNKGKDVGGCWPSELNQESILVMDRATSEYYNIAIQVAQCSFSDLQQNWDKSTFVVVYNNYLGAHCIYVNKLTNGKLCCINSYGNKDQFPQLNPKDVTAIYKVDAVAKKAPLYSQMKTPSPKLRRASQSASQASFTKQSELEAENERLKLENQQLKKENDKEKEEKDMLAKMVTENDKLEKAKKEKKNPLKKAAGWMKAAAGWMKGMKDK